MKSFKNHIGVALPMMGNNIDTDQIIPSREMKKVSKTGLAEGLFSGQRYLYEGTEKIGENPDFLLNSATYRNASILISGKNFGCGSSREHAVWALDEYGFRAIIAESFGTIFRNNCIRNGLLPIRLKAEKIQEIADHILGKNHTEKQADTSASELLIDLENLVIQTSNGKSYSFNIEDYSRTMLINGWDFIDLALLHEDEINQFREQDRKKRSWAYL